MRKVLMMLAVLFMCSSLGEAAERFMTFPTLGRCTGTSVRYRSDPDTSAEILGLLNPSDRIIVLGRTAVSGDVWYEIETPRDDKTAFVFGRYLEPFYNETSQQMESVKLIITLLEYYGITLDKARLFEGAGPFVRRSYNEYGYLERIDTQANGCPFGDVQVGDNVTKLTGILGEPDTKTDSSLEYRIGMNTELIFGYDDGKITRMIYEE